MKQDATQALTQLILETFRLNGRLLASGDSLVRDLGLTSARWQVLGAIALASQPLSVAHIARNMGLTRQAVQRLANEMERDQLVAFAPNPHHRRSQVLHMTAKGKAKYRAAMERQGPWVGKLAAGLGVRQIGAATALVRTVRQRLEDSERDKGKRPPPR
jgi:DNA-binding MarR family transcriptional regulator